jgi:hypothetical protein
VRVTGQLMNGADGGHIWADRYDRDLTDIFAIQDEITRTIVAQLKVKLLPEEKRVIEHTPTENIEAYTFLLARPEVPASPFQVILCSGQRMFAKAVEFDPLYARAYVGIADCDSFLILNYNEDVSVESILAASAKTLDLENGLAEAHASRGLALSLGRRYAEVKLEFEQAIALDTNLFRRTTSMPAPVLRRGSWSAPPSCSTARRRSIATTTSPCFSYLGSAGRSDMDGRSGRRRYAKASSVQNWNFNATQKIRDPPISVPSR